MTVYMETLFLTGAHGDVGRGVLPLLAKKYHVRAFVRNMLPEKKIPNVEWIRGDLSDKKSYENHLEGVHVLVHLAALLRSNDDKKLYKENVKNTLELVESAHRKGCSRIIVFSTAAVTQDVLTRYAESKKIMEDELKKINIPVYIVRPTLVYGKNSHYFNLFAKWARGKSPIVFLPNQGNAVISPVFNEDVARGILALAEKKPREVRTYDFCPPDVVTLRQFYDLVSKSAGESPKMVLSPPHAGVMALVHAMKPLRPIIPAFLLALAAAGFSYRVDSTSFTRDFRVVFKSAAEIIPRAGDELK